MWYSNKNIWVLGATLMMAQSAQADEWGGSKAELAVLPPYCAARFGGSQEAISSWKATMGSDFMHIHHYCIGLYLVNRARNMASSAKGRQGTLDAAIGNFDYILAHTQPTFYLRPDALMNRGIALSLLNRQGEAFSNLLKAIEMNPKLTPAYMTLSYMYEKLKNRSKALETVSEGLRHNPGTKSLQRRYTALGGKLPYPAPIEPPSIEAKAANPDETAAHIPVESSAGTSAAVTPTAEPIDAPKIGSPKNPYCRFCPD